jgi:hypothetical protein
VIKGIVIGFILAIAISVGCVLLPRLPSCYETLLHAEQMLDKRVFACRLPGGYNPDDVFHHSGELAERDVAVRERVQRPHVREPCLPDLFWLAEYGLR